MHEVVVEDKQITGRHEHLLGGREVHVDDLGVAEVGVGSLVRDVLVQPLPMRSGEHRERAVVGRRIGDREPHAHLVIRFEREVQRVLVPRLADRTRVLEDELRQEAVDVGAQEIAHHGKQPVVARERLEHRVPVVEDEHLRDGVLGVRRPRPRVPFGVNERMTDRLARRGTAAQLGRAGEHRVAGAGVGERRDHERAAVDPRVALVG